MKERESVTHYMATKLITFTPETDIREAIRVILKNKISGAPVLNQRGELVGMLSEKDCIRVVLTGPFNRQPGGTGVVGDFMSTAVKTVPSTMSILDVAYEFANAPYRRFPVVDGNRLVGQISRRDVLRAIDEMRPTVNHVPDTWKTRMPQNTTSKVSFLQSRESTRR